MIDFGGIDAGISEIPGYWPYLREAAVAVALNYGGVCARIYVARPPRAFLWGWRLLRPFLTEATDAKVLLEYLLLAYYLLVTHYSLLTLSTCYALLGGHRVAALGRAAHRALRLLATHRDDA